MTGDCRFCGRKGVEMVEGADLHFCRSCADLIDVPAALRHLPEKPPEPSARLGKYVLVRELSRSPAGAVYEARDPEADRRVAVKVLDAGSIGVDALPRFLREGRLLAKIRHPNVVEIHELGRDGDKVFIAMEFVDGVPFPGPVPRYEAIGRLVVVARALHHVHRQGMIHRDLKPTNILVEKGGRPVLMDFGIARSADPATTSAITATGAVLGTLGFMAPEQISGNVREIDARTDVYAMGVLLFDLLTGRLPVEASTVEEYARLLRKGQVPGPRSVRKDVSTALDRLCRKAMAPRKEDRHSSAEEFAVELLKARSAGTSFAGKLFRAIALGAGTAAILAAAVVGTVRAFAGGAPRTTPAPAAAAAQPSPDPLKDAADRKAKALGGTLSFEAAMAELTQIEGLYRRLRSIDPRAAASGLGRLYADLGRAPEAHREFDRVLEQEPGNQEILRAKGDLIVTTQLEILLDHRSFPEVSKALAAGLSEAQGRAMEDLLRRLPAEGLTTALARMYRAVARSEFDEARTLLSGIPASQSPPHLGTAIQALAEQARPAALPARTDDEGSPERGDSSVWLAILRHLDRRALRFRSSPHSPRTRVHAALLRSEALACEQRGDRVRGLELLGRAMVAAPGYLQARLARAQVLKELGKPDSSASEVQGALRSARDLGLGPRALEEIRSLP